MVRVSVAALIFGALSTASAMGQNYPPFLHEAEQVLFHEFQKLADQDWREWRSQQEWRIRQADEEDDAICARYQNYSNCREQLLAIRRDCAQAGYFFEPCD
jgi:hypothetical protein